MALERTSLVPPLFGDGHGRYRIHIVGNSGVGKSTLGAELASTLGLPFMPLDKIYWKPDWETSSHEQLREIVREFLVQHKNGWIIDGNYRSALGHMVDTEATDTICKDQFFHLPLLASPFPDSLPLHHPICRSCRKLVFLTLLPPASAEFCPLFAVHIGTISLFSTGLDPPLALYFPRICVRTFRRLFRLDPPCSPGCEESIREIFFSRESILWWCLTNHMVVRKRERENFRTNGIHVGGTYRRIGGWGRELSVWKASVRDLAAAQHVPDRGRFVAA